MPTNEIEISKITVPKDRRRLSGSADIAGSMAEVGLLCPIALTADFVLIAGLRRLEAAKSLGWTKIAAVIRDIEGLQVELAEIDENLIRNEPSALERADLLKRRKDVYEALHPDTKAGVAGGKARQSATDIVSVAGFAEETAKQTGVSARNIRRDVKLASDLDEEAKADLKATPTANNKSELKKLAKRKPETQRRAAKALKDGKAKTVAEAIKVAEPAEEHDAAEPPYPWADWLSKVEAAIQEVDKAANNLSRVAGINRDKNKAHKYAYFLNWTSTIGAIKSALETVDSHLPAEEDAKAPGFIPKHQFLTRTSLKGRKSAA